MSRLAGLGLLQISALCVGLFSQETKQILARQNSLADKTGWSCSVESEGDKNFKMAFGVGNGKDWKYLSLPFASKPQRIYRLKVEVDSHSVALSLDDEVARIKTIGTLFSPDSPLFLASRFKSPTIGSPYPWILGIKFIKVEGFAGSNPIFKKSVPDEKNPDPVLLGPDSWLAFSNGVFLMSRAQSPGMSLPRMDFDKIRIEAEFTLVGEAEFKKALDGAAPFVDTFGQYIRNHWTGKVSSQEDLVSTALMEEAAIEGKKRPEGFDAFGGITTSGFQFQAKGFYYTVKKKGFWWLVTPLGNPCFYLGLCGAGYGAETRVAGRESWFQNLPSPTGAWSSPRAEVTPPIDSACVNFNIVNLFRKFGDRWPERSRAIDVARTLDAGFSGWGKWVLPYWRGQLPYIEVIPRNTLHDRSGLPGNHPDVFDSKVRDAIMQNLREIILPKRSWSNLVGWSVGNEADEQIKTPEINARLAVSGGEAKRALLTHLFTNVCGNDIARLRQLSGEPSLQSPSDLIDKPVKLSDKAAVESLRIFFARAYHRFWYEAVKECDPNHLVFSGWLISSDIADWEAAGAWCDVVGWDHYSQDYNYTAERDQVESLLARLDKPGFCGEFGFPNWDNGIRGHSAYGTHTNTEGMSAQGYERWVGAAAKTPNCIGISWFTYRDQPITGRNQGKNEPAFSLGEENHAFGLVDVTDTPKRVLFESMKKANTEAARLRIQAMGQ